jgi:hypothetical protein
MMSIAQGVQHTFYRVIPFPFQSDLAM